MPTRRTVRVAEVLRKELSALMTQSLDLEGMLITISSVELPPDMKQAFIYVSTLNPEVEQASALKLLNRNRTPGGRGSIGRRLGIKFTPQLHFRFDDAIERGDRVMKILTQLEGEQDGAAGSGRAEMSGRAARRHDGRRPDQLRPFSFQPGIAPHAAGSVLACCGRTQVICAVTIEESVPRWMKEQQVPGGWITAEYSMLPYSTLGRKPRDITKGRLDGRSTEIQRLIGRSIRAVVDLQALGRADDLCRLRRARRRRRHAHHGDHRHLRGAGAGGEAKLRAEGTASRHGQVAHPRAFRRDQRRDGRRAGRCSISITSRTRTRRPT